MNTALAIIQKGVLLISGTLLIFISLSILLSPVDFYAASNITLSGNTSLMNELKAPAGLLLAAGIFIVSAIFLPDQTDKGLGAAALIYLSYAVARLFSIVVDGIPSASLAQATVLELVIGTSCLGMLLYRKQSHRELAPC